MKQWSGHGEGAFQHTDQPLLLFFRFGKNWKQTIASIHMSTRKNELHKGAQGFPTENCFLMSFMVLAAVAPKSQAAHAASDLRLAPCACARSQLASRSSREGGVSISSGWQDSALRTSLFKGLGAARRQSCPPTPFFSFSSMGLEKGHLWIAWQVSDAFYSKSGDPPSHFPSVLTKGFPADLNEKNWPSYRRPFWKGEKRAFESF